MSRTLSQIRTIAAAAFSDYLTGLCNRASFLRRGTGDRRSCLDRDEPCSIGDARHRPLQAANDTYGHEVSRPGAEGGCNPPAQRRSKTRTTCSRGSEARNRILLAGMDIRKQATSARCAHTRSRRSGSRSTTRPRRDRVDRVAQSRRAETSATTSTPRISFLYLAKHYGRTRVYSSSRSCQELTLKPSGPETAKRKREHTTQGWDWHPALRSLYRGSRTRQELFPLFSDPILRDLKKTYANGFRNPQVCLPSHRGRGDHSTSRPERRRARPR